jgi:hypothetical protein
VTTQLSLQEVVQIINIYLMPIYHPLGQNRINAYIGFHTLGGCDTTGRIFGKSKVAWWNAFSTASENVIKGLTELGVGEQPSDEVLGFCEEFICQLLDSKNQRYKKAHRFEVAYFLWFLKKSSDRKTTTNTRRSAMCDDRYW